MIGRWKNVSSPAIHRQLLRDPPKALPLQSVDPSGGGACSQESNELNVSTVGPESFKADYGPIT